MIKFRFHRRELARFDEPCSENVNLELYYLEKSILLIAKADIVLFCHDCAQRYGIRCLYFIE